MMSPKSPKQPEMVITLPAQALTLPAPKESKIAALIGQLTQSEGATLDAMVTSTSWQKHTVRAALTRLKARGYSITSVKTDGTRTYHASEPTAS